LIVLHPCVLTKDSNRQVLDGTSYQRLFERIDFKESDIAWTLERSVARMKVLGERGILPFVNSAHALNRHFCDFQGTHRATQDPSSEERAAELYRLHFPPLRNSGQEQKISCGAFQSRRSWLMRITAQYIIPWLVPLSASVLWICLAYGSPASTKPSTSQSAQNSAPTANYSVPS